MRLGMAITFLLLISAFSAQGALIGEQKGAQLQGLIPLKESQGLPVWDMQIGVVEGGANPQGSSASGKFTLKFPEIQPGGIARLNDGQFKPVFPRDSRVEPPILLCKDRDREEKARRSRRLKNSEAMEETYRRRVKELEDRNQVNEAALAGLRRERDQAKAAAGKGGEEPAPLKVEQTPELYQEAQLLFSRGKVEEAIKVLDEEKLRRSVEAARKRKAEAEKAEAEIIQGYLLKASLFTTKSRFDEALKTCQAAADASPDSWDACFALAYYNQTLNRRDQALAAYLRALEIARRSANRTSLANTLNNLGILDQDQNRMEEARTAFEEALTIRRQLAQQDPETHLPYVATTLNNLGRLHAAQSRMEEARVAYEEAHDIYARLAKKDPERYEPDVERVSRLLQGLGEKTTPAK